MTTLLDKAISKEGKIDYGIQSAGITQHVFANKNSLDICKKLMAVKYFAAVAITQALLPRFKKRNSGTITVISRIAGFIPFFSLRSGYAA